MKELTKQRSVALSGVMLLLALSVWLDRQYGLQMAGLLLIAALLGVTLYHAAFGFTSAYRVFILRRNAEGIIAQLLMLAVGSILFVPILSAGEIFGEPVGGALAPVGVSVVVGAFVFGIGMQLGDGCASGTLYKVGGGSWRMLITLASFIIGCVVATFHMPFWWGLPSVEAISLLDSFGWGPALLMQIGFIGLLYFMFQKFDRKDKRPGSMGKWRVLSGPWPLWAGALSLAFLNLATLITAGHPWSITWGFTLWGGKVAQAMGIDLTQTLFWGSGFQLAALQQSIFADITSVMNIGVILGATIAAGMARQYLPPISLSWGQLSSAVVGGLLMGYGARLAFGCNIGAFFSGVISFSLHGWVWILAAFSGTWFGVRLRPWFGFDHSIKQQA